SVREVQQAPQALVVTQGSSAETIGRKLAEMCLVRHHLVSRLLLLVRGVGGSLKAGEYSLAGPLSLDQIVDLLARGEVVRNEVTFPEGLNAVEASEIVGARGLSADAFLQATKNVALIQDLDSDASDLE